MSHDCPTFAYHSMPVQFSLQTNPGPSGTQDQYPHLQPGQTVSDLKVPTWWDSWERNEEVVRDLEQEGTAELVSTAVSYRVDPSDFYSRYPSVRGIVWEGGGENDQAEYRQKWSEFGSRLEKPWCNVKDISRTPASEQLLFQSVFLRSKDENHPLARAAARMDLATLSALSEGGEGKTEDELWGETLLDALSRLATVPDPAEDFVKFRATETHSRARRRVGAPEPGPEEVAKSFERFWSQLDWFVELDKSSVRGLLRSLGTDEERRRKMLLLFMSMGAKTERDPDQWVPMTVATGFIGQASAFGSRDTSARAGGERQAAEQAWKEWIFQMMDEMTDAEAAEFKAVVSAPLRRTLLDGAIKRLDQGVLRSLVEGNDAGIPTEIMDILKSNIPEEEQGSFQSALIANVKSRCRAASNTFGRKVVPWEMGRSRDEFSGEMEFAWILQSPGDKYSSLYLTDVRLMPPGTGNAGAGDKVQYTGFLHAFQNLSAEAE